MSEIPGLVAWFFCGIGITILAILYLTIRKQRRIQSWPESAGRIVESSTHGQFKRVGGHDSTWIEEAKVSYRYVVKGQEYIGHNICQMDMNSASQRDAKKTIEPYPVGAAVAVFYNPSAPQDAVLLKEVTPSTLRVVGFLGMAFLTFGMLALFGVI